VTSIKQNITEKLVFINHSCFLVEGADSILLIDPWVEGTAFNHGWALLDSSTSNHELIEYLESSSKRVFVWYSHEHSDHFSTSFVLDLKKQNLDVVILFHQTRDKRVVQYLKSQGLSVLEVSDGEEIAIGLEFSICTWNFYSGDSYSLIRYKDIEILNLNDCDVRSHELMEELKQKIQPKTKEISFLFTQFGYANWIGNEDDSAKRAEAAMANRERLRFQVDSLKPKIIIPFASFIYFCHQDNWYMNGEQNTPQMIMESEELLPVRDQIRFLCPWQEIELNRNSQFAKDEAESKKALTHWETCLNQISECKDESKSVSEGDFIDSIAQYVHLANRKYRYLPFLLSALKVIKPIYVKTWEDNHVYKCSYSGKPKIQNGANHWDISMSRSMAFFLFTREYGADTLSVSARFRCNSENSYALWQEFFKIQIFMREGIGSDSFISALRTLAVFPTGKLMKILKKNN
jgi:hypothetical protein